MTRQWQTLLGHALAQPDARLNNLELLTAEEQRRREESKLKRLKSSRRAAVDLRQFSPLLMIEPEAQPEAKQD
jgi:hypothetical protein